MTMTILFCQFTILGARDGPKFLLRLQKIWISQMSLAKVELYKQIEVGPL
jgi:hypothetical protein